MGEVKADLRVWSSDRSRSVDFAATTVDTGATYSLIPRPVLEELDVEARGRVYAELADGRVIAYEMGEARLSINGETVTTNVLFAHEGEEPLIGVVTLEEMRLAVDPVAGELVPVRYIRR